jgi:hypothetical protein
MFAWFVTRYGGLDQAHYTDLKDGSVTPTGQRSDYFRFSDAQNLTSTPEFLRKICDSPPPLPPPRIFTQNMYPSQ